MAGAGQEGFPGLGERGLNCCQLLEAVSLSLRVLRPAHTPGPRHAGFQRAGMRIATMQGAAERRKLKEAL